MSSHCRTCLRPLTADEQADPRDPDICDDCLWRELDRREELEASWRAEALEMKRGLS